TGLQSGWEVTVPADTTSRTLKLFVGVFKAKGSLDAVLSDRSVGIFNDSVEKATAARVIAYTANFRGSAAGQKLNPRCTCQNHRGGGNITLQAATLGPGPP